jgi:branched-subunit amino acid transport protein
VSDLWWVVIGASLAVFAIKLAGYVVPQRLVEGPVLSRVAAIVTVALLASLVASQTLQGPGGLLFDARIPALVVAAVLLWIRAPFIVVIIGAAAVAAGLRFFGLMP